MSARRAALAAGLTLLLTAAATYAAGERVEVVVPRTLDGDGELRASKLWVVDHGGVPWVRVAKPDREWFQRPSRHPRAERVRNAAAIPAVVPVGGSPGDGAAS